MKKQPHRSESWREIFLIGERIRTLWQTPAMHRKAGQLTLAQAKLMFFVFACTDDGIRQKELARELGITPGAVSQTVDSLVKTGLLERVQDPSDRRAIAIRPSQKAARYRAERDAALGTIMAKLFDGISPEESAVCQTVLAKLTENARKLIHKKKTK